METVTDRMGSKPILPVNGAFDADVDVTGSLGVNKALAVSIELNIRNQKIIRLHIQFRLM